MDELEPEVEASLASLVGDWASGSSSGVSSALGPSVGWVSGSVLPVSSEPTLSSAAALSSLPTPSSIATGVESSAPASVFGPFPAVPDWASVALMAASFEESSSDDPVCELVLLVPSEPLSPSAAESKRLRAQPLRSSAKASPHFDVAKRRLRP
jgi:hypothetical protein